MLSDKIQDTQALRSILEHATYDLMSGHYAVALDPEQCSNLIASAKQVGLPKALISEHYALGTLLLEKHQLEYLKLQLATGQQAWERLQAFTQPNDETHIDRLRYGVVARLGLCGNGKLKEFLQKTHMIGVVTPHSMKERRFYALVCTRDTVLEGIGMIRPDIEKQAREKMQEEGINPNSYGELPISEQQIEQFLTSYDKVICAYVAKGKDGKGDVAKGERAMAELATHYLIRTPAPTSWSGKQTLQAPPSPLVQRGTLGRVMLSQQPTEESINQFMLPLEVLEPIRDTLKRVEHAQDPHNSGEHEKMRPNSHEAWIGYKERSLMVARGRQLEKLLELHSTGDEKIRCMTVYPMRDGRKTHIEPQSLHFAHNEPQISETTRSKIVEHRPEYWLAIPQSLLPALRHEADTMREQTQDAKDVFVQALKEADPDKRNTMRKEAEDYLQLILDEYSDRGVLAENFATRALRSKPDIKGRQGI